eukprot:g5603.t1
MVCVSKNASSFGNVKDLKEDTIFERETALFVSENTRGEIWKITWNGSSYDQTKLKLSDAFTRFAGLAKNEKEEIFALGNPRKGNGCQMIKLSSWSGETSYTVIANLPRLCLGGGLAYYGNNVFYAASEGDFFPFEGEVYRIENQKVHVIQDHGFADDGVFIDTANELLYVSEAESVSHKMLVLNASNGSSLLGMMKIGNVNMIDDFTVEALTGRIVAADFLAGKVVRFKGWKDSKSPTAEVLLSGITSPTSARFGCVSDIHHGFSDKLIFVSEGGGLLSSTHDRRVIAFSAAAI